MKLESKGTDILTIGGSSRRSKKLDRVWADSAGTGRLRLLSCDFWFLSERWRGCDLPIQDSDMVDALSLPVFVILFTSLNEA